MVCRTRVDQGLAGAVHDIECIEFRLRDGSTRAHEIANFDPDVSWRPDDAVSWRKVTFHTIGDKSPTYHTEFKEL